MLNEEMHNVIKLAVLEANDQRDRVPVVDHEARNMANAALQTIASHERVCAERDKNAVIQRDRVEAKVDEQGKAQAEQGRAMAAMQRQLLNAVILILLGMVGFLLGQYYITHL